MGWFNRLVVRNGTIGLGIVLKRIRFAEKAEAEYHERGHLFLAEQWRVKRNMLERRFREMHADLEQRLDRERAAP